MVPAGQWQAVKDTLSRPNVRSLTTSDTLGNPTTSTFYDPSRYSQYHIAMIYLITANYIRWPFSLQPILHSQDLSRYSQHHIAMIHLVTANPTLLGSISIQPIQLILHGYDLSHHSQYYIALLYLTTANPTLLWPISFSQYHITMIYLVTANITLLWSISSQPLLHYYNLSRYSQY